MIGPWSSWCRSDATKPASTSSGLRDESLEESDNVSEPTLSLMKSQPRDSLPRGTAPSHGPWSHLGVGLLSPLLFANSAISGHDTFIIVVYVRRPGIKVSSQRYSE